MLTDDEIKALPDSIWTHAKIATLCEEVLRLRADRDLWRSEMFHLRAEVERLRAEASPSTVDLSNLPKRAPRFNFTDSGSEDDGA